MSLLQLNKKEAIEALAIERSVNGCFVLEDRMDMFSRLVSAGLSVESALEALAWFRQQGDDKGLDRFVREVGKKYGVY